MENTNNEHASSAMEYDVEELKKDVASVRKTVDRLEKSMYGDPDDRNSIGMAEEFRVMDRNQRQTNQTLTEMQADLKKIMWAVILGVVGGVMTLLFKAA